MPYFVTQSLNSEALHDENHALWRSSDPNSTLIRETAVEQTDSWEFWIGVMYSHLKWEVGRGYSVTVKCDGYGSHFDKMCLSLCFSNFKVILYSQCVGGKSMSCVKKFDWKTKLDTSRVVVFKIELFINIVVYQWVLCLTKCLCTAQISQESISVLNPSLRYSCSSVTPEKQWASDKCSTDIAVLIFFHSGSCRLLWATGFILHDHNKNNRPVKDAPRGITLPLHPEEQFTQDLDV